MNAKRQRHTFMRLAMMACILGGCGRAAQLYAPPQAVEVSIAKGTQIPAVFYQARSANPPGLLAIPGYAGGQSRWEAFGRQAQREGMHGIAVDAILPDMGASDLPRFFDALDGAIQTLINHGAAPHNLIIIAESDAAPAALQYASKQRSLAAVILVSPTPEYAGVSTLDAIQELGQRPVLLMVATGDSLAASTVRQLKQASPGQCEIREYAGSTHGADLLDASAQAMGQVFVWLDPIVGQNS